MRWIAIGCVVLAGCTTTSGVIADGPDTYTIIEAGKTGFTSSADLKIRAYQKASAFCSGKAASLTTIDEKETRGGVLGKFPEAQIRFRCEQK